MRVLNLDHFIEDWFSYQAIGGLVSIKSSNFFHRFISHEEIKTLKTLLIFWFLIQSKNLIHPPYQMKYLTSIHLISNF